MAETQSVRAQTAKWLHVQLSCAKHAALGAGLWHSQVQYASAGLSVRYTSGYLDSNIKELAFAFVDCDLAEIIALPRAGWRCHSTAVANQYEEFC